MVSGLGALVFYYALDFMTTLLLGYGAGYYPPLPAGEGGTSYVLSTTAYLIPIVTTLGGLVCGLIVFRFAPEAEGHGTDAAIDAFHNKRGLIRSRVPLVKLAASTFTIGSGGSAGREGPTAQIGAGFGSLLSRLLNLNVRDRRIAVAVGIGAGIGSIFKTPFGGAVLAAEILYREDFEVVALPPALLASTIGYSIFASVTGWTPIFGTMALPAFHDPVYLPIYALLGLVCGLVAIAHVRLFYGLKNAFARLGIPNYVKPAIGGLIVGLIGIFLPQILGTGYGWLQLVIDGDFSLLPLGLILILIVMKMMATSLTVGSEGVAGCSRRPCSWVVWSVPPCGS